MQAELEKVNKRSNKMARLGKKFGMQTGVGLAAPQIGIHKQVCLLKPGGKPWVLMNPILVAHSETKIPVTEGCLSFPGKHVETFRYLWVEYATLNLGVVCFGPKNPDDFSAQSLLISVIAQHEVDHLFSKLFFDATKE